MALSSPKQNLVGKYVGLRDFRRPLLINLVTPTGDPVRVNNSALYFLPETFYHSKKILMLNQLPMDIVHPRAAGIDVGSRSHYVAAGQGEGQVGEFRVNTADHQQMITWLGASKITTIAMESTGSYWQTLFEPFNQQVLKFGWSVAGM